MKDGYTRVVLWQVKESAAAIYFSRVPPLGGPLVKEHCLWLPRSQIDHISRDAERPGHLRQCTVDVADWLAEKHEL